MLLVWRASFTFSGSAPVIVPTSGEFLGQRVPDMVSRFLSDVYIKYSGEGNSKSREDTT